MNCESHRVAIYFEKLFWYCYPLFIEEQGEYHDIPALLAKIKMPSFKNQCKILNDCEDFLEIMKREEQDGKLWRALDNFDGDQENRYIQKKYYFVLVHVIYNPELRKEGTKKKWKSLYKSLSRQGLSNKDYWYARQDVEAQERNVQNNQPQLIPEQNPPIALGEGSTLAFEAQIAILTNENLHFALEEGSLSSLEEYQMPHFSENSNSMQHITTKEPDNISTGKDLFAEEEQATIKENWKNFKWL